MQSLQSKTQNALVIVDMQTDALRSIPQKASVARLIDSVETCIHVARQANWPIFFTGLQFEAPDYRDVSISHRLYGSLRRLATLQPNNTQIRWFQQAGSASIEPRLWRAANGSEQTSDNTFVALRNRHLQSRETLIEPLKARNITHLTVVGIHTSRSVQMTVQQLMDDAFQVTAVVDAMADASPAAHDAVCQHVLPTFCQGVLQLSELVDQTIGWSAYRYIDKHGSAAMESSMAINYLTNCQRGGHFDLFKAHLLQQETWTTWPTQTWYVEQHPFRMDAGKTYQCPLGHRVVDFCDEPKFSRTSMFLQGRAWLDEKEKLFALLSNFESNSTINLPETYIMAQGEWEGLPPPDHTELRSGPWFVKEADKNGGKAVHVCRSILDAQELATNIQRRCVLQRHIDDPMLTQGRLCKFHIKLYSLLLQEQDAESDSHTSSRWKLYTWPEAFLSVADLPWNPTDIRPEVQITTLRHARLTCDEGWKHEYLPANFWNQHYSSCQTVVKTMVEAAIVQGKLEKRDVPCERQFEIFSTDLMMDCHGTLWLIESNFSPVVFDPVMKVQELTTKGLKAYQRLYDQLGDKAVVNDHDMIRDAVRLVFGNQTKVRWDLAMNLQQE